jgi:hypothetical protein
MTDADLLTKTRDRLAAERERWRRAAQAAVRPPPGVTWRPTPNRDECNRMAASGRLVTQKLWDLSPVDQSSFDPTQPPSELPPPPQNTAPPFIQFLDGVEVGDVLARNNGTWTGSPTYTYVWTRDGAPIPGATGLTYTLVEADVTFMIGLVVTGTNAGGSTDASAIPVGPIEPAPPLAAAKATRKPKAR